MESRPLSLAAGRSVWLKLEALQPTGSFKLRGIGAACEAYARRGARRFVSSSGGNAGIAVAYAGRALGLPVIVVVPDSTSQHARALLQLHGAEVIVHGQTWQEANDRAQSLVCPRDAFLHPFDDALLWSGHSSLVDELVRAAVQPDAVILSVGGGGLLSGVVEGLQRVGWNHVPVLAVEPEGAASFHAALRAGHPVQLAQIESVATSLGAKRVCERAVCWSKRHPIESILVSDDRALDACTRFLDDHRLLVEPACGASLAVAYGSAAALARFERVLIIVCGGATMTASQLAKWLAR